MKKIIITFVIGLVALGLTACQTRNTPGVAPNDAATTSDLSVLAVEPFLADIAQNVAGERVTVETLMPLGLDPHAYEPAPKDVARIVNTSVLIVNGGGFEAWLDETIANVGGERVMIVASDGMNSREAREGEEAVLSPEEKAAAICSVLSELPAGEETAAGNDAASAAALNHDEASIAADEGSHEPMEELLTVTLHAGLDGTYAGFLQFDVTEDGEYVIAAASGTLVVTDDSGAEMEVEEDLGLNCAGLNGGILLDLEPGGYVIALADTASETMPFYAGSAGSHHHHEGDPHFWLDPLNVIRYVENIRAGLIAADPEGTEVYTRNAEAYIAELKELDAWIQDEISAIPQKQRMIVTNHESFGYFADRYGFQIIGTVIPSVSTDSAPSAREMVHLIDRIQETGAKALFLETGSNPKLAEQIAGETGIKVVSELYTHSLTGPDGAAPNYIEMMKTNVRAIVEALK